MTRNEFLKQLEALLKDLPEHDRQDAMAYYEDYFEEAGPENEAALIQKLGSPHKVAETIKCETGFGENESGKNGLGGSAHGEYTEYGYSDGREGVNPNTPAAGHSQQQKQKQKRQISWPLIIVLLIFTSPIWGGLLSGLIGAAAGIVAAIFGIMVAVAALVLVGIIGGFVCMAVGIGELFVTPALGLLLLGLGAVFLAIGLLLLLVVVWLFGKAVPAVLRFVVDGIQKIVYRWRRKGV